MFMYTSILISIWKRQIMPKKIFYPADPYLQDHSTTPQKMKTWQRYYSQPRADNIPFYYTIRRVSSRRNAARTGECERGTANTRVKKSLNLLRPLSQTRPLSQVSRNICVLFIPLFLSFISLSFIFFYGVITINNISILTKIYFVLVLLFFWTQYI